MKMKVRTAFTLFLLFETLLFILDMSTPNDANKYLMVVSTTIFYWAVLREVRKAKRKEEFKNVSVSNVL